MLPSLVSIAPEDLLWERAMAAREIPPERRLLRGQELFDESCAIALDAIR